jgi:hypothetical protein
VLVGGWFVVYSDFFPLPVESFLGKFFGTIVSRLKAYDKFISRSKNEICLWFWYAAKIIFADNLYHTKV